MADDTYQPLVYHKQGGDEEVVASSGIIRVEDGGTIIFEGSGAISDTGKWDDLRVPPNATKLSGLQDPDFAALTGNISIYWFDKGTEESLYFNVQLPHDWKPQSNLRPHVHWCVASASTLVVRWALEYSFAEIDSTMSTAVVTYTSDYPLGNSYHQLSDFNSLDMSGVSSSSVSAMFACRLFRDSSNAADTFDGDAGLLEFDFHYQKSRLGSTALDG